MSELRDQRVDQRATCLALLARLDRAHDDAGAAHDDSTAATAAAHTDTTAAAAAAHDDAGALVPHVDGVRDAVQAIPAPSSSGAYDGPSAAQVNDAARTLHGDLWLFLGAGAALIFGLPFLRMVTPWWRS